jgi:N-formylglutamate amidohydrolase
MSRGENGKFPAPAFCGGDGAEPYPASAELNPPFEVLEPAHLSCPLVFSSPHSGKSYPAEFLAATRLDPLALRRSEDAHVDDLFRGVVELGAPLIRAFFPRAYLDPNREPYELDPRMFEGRLPPFANTRSIRVAGGLGTIPRVVGESQEIYARKLPVADALRRIETLYKPYHRALRGLMQRALVGWRCAVLVDCHSMPSSSSSGERLNNKLRADIVLGDRYGTSCHPAISEAFDAELRRRGYLVQRNTPYAGGFITEHYGNPSVGTHAIQIEVNRALYLDEKSLVLREEATCLTADLISVAANIADLVGGGLPPLRSAAAE